MAESEKPAPEENNADAPRPSAGAQIRDARQRAGLSVEKVCADLRISSATLSALEAGEYGKLAGAPYTRALIVSLSRYLRLDSREVLLAYAEETGNSPSAAPTVTPYKDDSKSHARAHKQIFILILLGLLLILLLIVGKFSSTSPDDVEPVAPPTSIDTLLNIEPEIDSLLPDSLALDSAATDSVALAGAATPAATGSARPEKEKGNETVEADLPGEETRVRIVAISDNVYVRVLPAGQRERSHTLSIGEALEVSHDDAITFITRNSNTVEVTVGGTTVIPDKRRFKADGSTVTY